MHADFPMNSATPDAMRRRAIGQILLLTAGFLVLVAISTASVLLVNKARQDNALVVHTLEVENSINALLLEMEQGPPPVGGPPPQLAQVEALSKRRDQALEGGVVGALGIRGDDPKQALVGEVLVTVTA